jgi:polysaccharide biosynthesis protein PslH
MKILWVKAGGLVPPELGGRIRSYHILRELAKRHRVTLFTFYATQTNDPHGELNQLFERVFYWPLPIATSRGLSELVSFVRHSIRPWPHSVAKYCRPEVARAMRQLLAENTYDVLVCDFAIAAGVIPWDAPTPKVLFTHNVEALIWQRHYRVSHNPLWKLISWGEYRKMMRFERVCLERSQHVLTVSEADRAFFRQFVDGAKLSLIPTGVDTEYFRPVVGLERPASLVFTGAMDWMPNQDAIVYFVRTILPIIRREIPDVEFAIVGRHPTSKLRAALSRDSSIRLTGGVEDIRPYVHQAAVYIVPLRIGSGTRLKIFEAMAMGKAIVSTTVGAEGLPVTDGSHLVLADRPEDFAQRVVSLLRDPAERQRLGAAGRALVEQCCSWRSVAAEFDAVLQSVVSQRQPECAAIRARV